MLSVYPLINFWMPEPIFMKRGMYNMAPDPISMTYFINPSNHFVSVYVYPLSLLGNGSVKIYRGNKHTCNNRRIFGSVVFYTV
jgi:hypothetical protein